MYLFNKIPTHASRLLILKLSQFMLLTQKNKSTVIIIITSP